MLPVMWKGSPRIVLGGCLCVLGVILCFSGGTAVEAAPSLEPGAPDANWNTFLGGEDWDDGYGVAVDGSGNIYVVGMSTGSWGSPLRPYAGNDDAFVAKLNSNGVLQWNTFLGSASGQDEGYAIAVDANGNVSVTGTSLFSWGNPINGHSGESLDAFVARLNTHGVLQWHTFMGGFSIDKGHGIDLDASGNVYVTGESHGEWGSPVVPPSSPSTDQEAFAAKLFSNGNRAWNTFMGERNGDDFSKAIAFDDGTVSVTGYSKNSWGSPKRLHSGDSYGDAFAARLSANNGNRLWNTFLGGGETDEGLGIAADANKVYVTGYSEAYSSGGWGNPINPFPGRSKNVFVVRLSSGGVLEWNTFLGAGDYENDQGNAIAVEADELYVIGESAETWGDPIHAHADDWDAFAAGLNTNGALLWNTFIGGDDSDHGYGVALKGTNLTTTGTSFVSYGGWGTPVRPSSDSWDAFVVKMFTDPTLTETVYLPLVLVQ